MENRSKEYTYEKSNRMDPLFERRTLTKKVHVNSKFIKQNIQTSIMHELEHKFGGKCLPEGFIGKKSITIVAHSLGRANYIKGGVDYDVTFQADVCMPHVGQRFKAPVHLKSKIGIHAKTPPVEVLIPRDLHIGDEEFENVKVDEDIEFEVVGSQFKQEDETIVIVGRLLTKIKAEAEKPLLSVEEKNEETVQKADIPKSEAGETMRVVITNPVDDKPKKRRLKRKEDVNTNEQFPTLKERVIEGAP